MIHDHGAGGAGPLVMAHILGAEHWLYKLLTFIGLFGLIASFHGIILAAGRATLEFGREGFAPKFLGKIHPDRKTPVNALILNMVIGIIALLTGKTADIITIACFGALTLYIISMISLFVLRKKDPQLERPFKVPLYPYFPFIALVIAVVSLISISYFNPVLALIFFGIIGFSYLVYSSINKPGK